MKKLFDVEISKYVQGRDFHVYRAASLDNPKDNSVMFITLSFIKQIDSLRKCANCLVFFPYDEEIPEDISEVHAIVQCDDPRSEYCRFYKDNNITYYPEIDEYELINGAYIAKTAIIGNNCRIFPGSYIGGDVIIKDNVYIGSGVKLIGKVVIGNNVIIRENSVIGADGLSTNRDENGEALTMPQFGGVIIEDNVQIGALTVIGRGAIDNTYISKGCKIDNCSFISHNVHLGESTFIVGESIMFGSSSTGKEAYISGNATIRDGIHIGEKAIIGMGAVVVKSVDDGKIVKGNPAK